MRMVAERMRMRDVITIERRYRAGWGDLVMWLIIVFGIGYVLAHLMLLVIR